MTSRLSALCLLASLGAGAAACSSATEVPPAPPADGADRRPTPLSDIVTSGGDPRPAIEAATPPPPISGGNLLLTRDGRFAVVADSDRDRLVLVDVSARQVTATLPLSPGDEPGRATEGASGQVYVALRRGNAVVTLDVDSASLVERRAACGGPRGIAFDAAREELWVACADGQLVSLPSSGGTPTVSASLGADLRDVMVDERGVWVSTFKQAGLLRVEAGEVTTSVHLPAVHARPMGQAAGLGSFQPEVAWRTQALGDRIVVLHQAALSDPVPLPPDSEADSGDAPPSYGDGSPCGSVVRSALSVVEADGSVHTSAALGGGTLPVDFDISPSGAVAVAYASSSSAGEAGGTFGVYPNGALALDLSVRAPAGQEASSFGQCAATSRGPLLPSGTVAVRFSPSNPDLLLAFAREPAQLYFYDLRTRAAPAALELGGDDVSDSGHALFHDDAGRGIACASCHPEGAEDGHVWTFAGIGPRRTQALDADLRDTAPYHWSGDLTSVGALMQTVFVERMGGLPETRERVSALERFLFSLPPLPPLRSASDPAAERGAALFASAETGCVACHVGPAFTNNRSAAVGTSPGGRLQVPSLLGIAHRAPFLHTGCAATLRARFDQSCGGGELHGHTAQLTGAQLDDLVAYLETL